VTDYLVDTSAWIEYLRKTGSPANLLVRELLGSGGSVHLTEPVIMKLLAGAGPRTMGRLEKLVGAFPLLRVDHALDYHQAARIYRLVRSSGDTPRSHLGCLIVAVASRTEATLVHADRDFRIIAQRYHVDLAPE
jgi:predicted nucleic acid-binding protein